MINSSQLALYGTAVLVITACSSPAPQFTAADEATVRAMFDSTVARVNAKDFRHWAGAFADSGVFHAPNTRAKHGRAAIQAYGEAFPPLEAFSMSDVEVWGEGNLSYGTSNIVIKVKDAPADTAKQLVVFRRGPSGNWEIVAGSFNTSLPPTLPPVLLTSPTMSRPKK